MQASGEEIRVQLVQGCRGWGLDWREIRCLVTVLAHTSESWKMGRNNVFISLRMGLGASASSSLDAPLIEATSWMKLDSDRFPSG